MRFAVVLPVWGYLLAFAASLALAWYTYAGVRLPARSRWLLTGLRALTLVLLVATVLRPIRLVPPATARDRIVPVLVDVSRSMRIADAEGPARLQRARSAAETLVASLGTSFRTEVWTFGDGVAPGDLGRLQASAGRSDIGGALSAIADRYRGRALGGIVVISDGGDTAVREDLVSDAAAAPVFTVGVGTPAITRDREVVAMAAGEPRLADSTVDVHVSALSTGYGTQPLEMTLTANGRPVDVRRVAAADGAPVHTVFTVSPDPTAPTVYQVAVPVAPGEIAAENNTRSVLVEPPGRRRRLLLIEGAPGYEHTFLKRALAHDTSLDVDSVVRKGVADDGRPTFFVQAAASRAASLASGFPEVRADLFQYDAVVFGNVEAAFFTRAQLEDTAAFVAARGGGLLVFGGRSFEQQGLARTPIDEVLPVDMSDRRALVARVSGAVAAGGTPVALTADGADHPATRSGATAEEARRAWEGLPPLASVSIVGGPRPGAQVLAVAAGAAGETRPLLAVQRYGQGRAMVFAGEASWRWRMMLPAADTRYDTIWRQMARWLTRGSTEPVAITSATASSPGVTDVVAVLVRDRAFEPVRDAEVRLTVAEPGGTERQVTATLADPTDGRYAAAVRFDDIGVYRIRADARRGGDVLGSAERAVLSGGADPEMADPRLNEAVLQRLAAATGGAYVRAADVARIPPLLQTSGGPAGPPEVRDLWHGAWVLLAIIALLGAEWALRRRMGLA
jgi:uncharacterized membrane protein